VSRATNVSAGRYVKSRPTAGVAISYVRDDVQDLEREETAEPDHDRSRPQRADDSCDADTGLDRADVPYEVGVERLERGPASRRTTAARGRPTGPGRR